MNLTMQQPLNYPFYMGSPQFPYPYQWPSNAAYHYPPAHLSYPLPFVLSHQPRATLPPKPLQATFSPYTNTRYNHLKQSTSHVNRHRSLDTSVHFVRQLIPNHHYRPLKTKSVSDFHQLSQPNPTNLLKAQSWHSMQHLHQPNVNANYSTPAPFVQDHNNYNHHQHHQHYHSSPKRKKKSSHQRNCSSSSSNQLIPDQGLVRISTYETMPVMHNPLYQGNTFPNDKIKTSISTNSHRQSSPSSTASSQSSFQKRLNGSLRNDPLLNAAMEDFRQLRRTSSQSTSFTVHKRDISRDSLCSNSSHHSSSSSSSSARSRSHIQSSFTSLERLEIRHLIKALKAKGLPTMNSSFPLLSSPPPLSQRSLIKQSSSLPTDKPQKSSITEELDEEFQKIRSNHPNEDLIYVKPSLMHKRKQPIPSLLKSKEIEEKSSANSDLPIPIIQIKSDSLSQIPSNEKSLSESKPEYAVPMKKSSQILLRSPKKEEHMRSFSFCKPITDLVQDTSSTRPASMFNWLQYGLTNPLPTTFQPLSASNNRDKSLVKENIYASDIEIHLPLANEKDYLYDANLMKDYLVDYKEQSAARSSIFNDFSRLFTRSAHQKQKSKLHKTNSPHHHHSRCSIM